MPISLEALSNVFYFAGLSHAELNKVKKYIAFEKIIDKGETILSEGSNSEYVYFIISGTVKVYKRSVDGKEQVLDIISKGDSSGDVATFDVSPDQASMLALTPVHLYAIKKGDLINIIKENSRVGLNALKVMAGRLHRDTDLLGELSFYQVISRLAKLLIRQSANRPDLLVRFTQQDLAALVGTSRVVVNRSLRSLEEKGAIRLERRRIIITDEKLLQKLADGIGI